MRRNCVFLVCFLFLLINCEDPEESLAKSGYGKEKPYATGVLKPTIVSYNGNKLVFDFNFVVYDESGAVPEEAFQLEREEAVFTGGTRMSFNQLSVEKISGQSNDCYDATILMENNPMERPERLEVASRYIFKNTPQCSQFNFAYYPERNKDFEVIDAFKIERSRFINDPAEFDYPLAEVSNNNFEMYLKEVAIDKTTQFEALEAALIFSAEKSAAPSKQILMMYENYHTETSADLQNLTSFAQNNGITINVNKNYLENNDVLLNVAYQTGGIYFIQEEYDFFQPRNQPDSYVMALHADDFFSGKYTYYSARYEVTTTGASFSPDFWFRLSITVKLPDDVSKPLPLYVYIP